ncbi:MAG TPA: DUF1569 domain-containing protein [Pirellulales bacterium]|nr:DUF1569 domain-containing protein [Pirellulales bacterium]
MAVKTGKVTGRREVHYDSYQDLLNDAERLAGGEVRLLGNWSLGQILAHLSRGMEFAIDGIPYKAPWPIRTVVRLFMRRRIITRPMSAGFTLPGRAADFLVPGPINTDEGLAMLRVAIQRLRDETERSPHALLGEMSLDEWDSLHLRHSELHMSFVVPVQAPARAP